MQNQRRYELIQKKNRAGLTRSEAAELERLQTESLAESNIIRTPMLDAAAVDRIKRRNAGRGEAAAMRELCQETIARLATESVEAVAAFCEEMRAFFGPSPKAEKPGRGPMTDAEAREFGRREIGYGQFKGSQYCDLPKGRLDYYLEKAEETVRDLSRYLANEKIAEQLREELERERPHD